MQTHDLQPLRLKTTSASENEISHLLKTNNVNVLALLIYYKLFHCIVCGLNRIKERVFNLNVRRLGSVFILISFVYVHCAVVVP